MILEAQSGYHNALVRHGLTIGMILFIASEVMFFVAWFWAFFGSAIDPSDPQVVGRLDFTGGMWPPKGTEVLDPLRLPLMNTFVLVTSSFAVNIAHDDLREGNRQGFKNFLLVGILLGVLFAITQAYEYIHAPFPFKNSIYGATFFMATGFHGAHVIIGVIFLTVCLARGLGRPDDAAATPRIPVRRLVLAFRRRGVDLPVQLHLHLGLLGGADRRGGRRLRLRRTRPGARALAEALDDGCKQRDGAAEGRSGRHDRPPAGGRHEGSDGRRPCRGDAARLRHANDDHADGKSVGRRPRRPYAARDG